MNIVVRYSPPGQNLLLLLSLALVLGGCAAHKAVVNLNEPELMAWGNLTGIRVDGQLMEFGTSLRVVNPDWSQAIETRKEVNSQKHMYTRAENQQIVTAQLAPFSFREILEGTKAAGVATVNVQVTAQSDTNIAGVFFCVKLPRKDFSSSRVELIDPEAGAPAITSLPATGDTARQSEYVRARAGGIRFMTADRQLEAVCATATEIVIKDDIAIAGSNHPRHLDNARPDTTSIQVHFALLSGNAKREQMAQNTFSLKFTGDIDKNPVELVLDTSKPGQLFDGLGGNFRLQNPETDPPVIQYNLEHMRVAWGRVEMPWPFWHPEEDVDPVESAKAGKLNPRVHAAMEMARTLAMKGAPVIVSAWSAPAWAIIGDPRQAFRPQQGGLRGYPLNPKKMSKIYESITAYLLYLKQNYGVEAVMFSFNESDLGINVRQTAEEHADFIKGLGAVLADNGLATRLLLGDTSDAHPIDFIRPAMADPEAVKYIGAVSFHSWRGCTDELLRQWRAAARELNLPLLVGEGSTDAAAWRYPQIFDESSFALHEISLYTRICGIAQPKSILQWQLTADYSLLAGGGVFGNEKETLRPTQRFWNLKQLASTPEGAFALPITSNSQQLTCAAFGDIAGGTYVVHIVNNGAARPATLTGLPEELTRLKMYVTDQVSGMKAGPGVPVVNGTAQFQLRAASFTTLMNEPPQNNSRSQTE